MSDIKPTFTLDVENLLRSGDHQEALTLCKKGIEAYPDYPMAYSILIRIYKEMGNKDDATKIAEEATEIFPDNRLINSAREEIKNEKIEDPVVDKENNINQFHDETTGGSNDEKESAEAEKSNDESSDDDEDFFDLDDVEEVEIETNYDSNNTVFDTDSVVHIDHDDNNDIIEFEQDDMSDTESSTQTVPDSAEIDDDKSTELVNPPDYEEEYDFHSVLGRSDDDEDGVEDTDGLIDELSETLQEADKIIEKDERSESEKVTETQLSSEESSPPSDVQYEIRDHTELDGSGVKISELIVESKDLKHLPKDLKRRRRVYSKINFGYKEKFITPTKNSHSQKANKSDVGELTVSETMANILALQGAKKEAIEMYRKLAELEPEKADHYNTKINTLT